VTLAVRNLTNGNFEGQQRVRSNKSLVEFDIGRRKARRDGRVTDLSMVVDGEGNLANAQGVETADCVSLVRRGKERHGLFDGVRVIQRQ